MGAVVGKACSGRCTKMLVLRLCKNNIAVIKHRGLDLVAAEELKNKHIRAVINCEKTIIHSWGLSAVDYLLKNGIDIYEVQNTELMYAINDGDEICITDNNIYVNGKYCTGCTRVTADSKNSDINAETDEKRKFLANTIEYMEDELEYFLKCDQIPKVEWCLDGKDAVIVCRGRGYREDLKAVKKYITEKKPVLIGVDGGANAIYEAGLKCDVILGDMDSVSDSSLLCCSRIFVHSYSDGIAPGLSRIKNLGLDYELVKLKGTSEDAAIFLCSLKGASTIYLIGGHIGMEEFLEKGRSGMGSTALLRMLLGTKIVDLKGISRLSVHRGNLKSVAAVIAFLLGLTSLLFNYGVFEHIQSGIKALLK